MSRTIRSVILISLLALLSACLEWHEDSRGNVSSVGLTGLPIWTAPKRAQDMHRNELDADAATGDQWLDELNKWRTMAGVAPVGENLALNHGSELHAQYLVDQIPAGFTDFPQAATAMGGEAHHEKPGAPGYSQEGEEAAAGGRHVDGALWAADVAWAQRDPTDDIDSLLVAPFHRLSLLAPWAKVAGYGRFGTYPRSAAALALRGPSDNTGGAEVKFPPDGSTVPIPAMTTPEWPNPIASCPGYSYLVGLPITLQVGPKTAGGLATYSLRDQTDNRGLESCAFDSATYVNPDPAQQVHARLALKGFGAVIMIPRLPLHPGHSYQVTINAFDRNYTWMFTIGTGEHPVQASAR